MFTVNFDLYCTGTQIASRTDWFQYNVIKKGTHTVIGGVQIRLAEH